jgi:aminoglycoside phosphotransferase (APT) family kinase protein
MHIDTPLEDRLEPLLDWMAEAGHPLAAPVALTTLRGGRSNHTVHIVDAQGAQVVLRRPPFGPRLPSAHDVVREARIMRGLADTDVPVPRILAVCEDDDVIGAPFTVMSFVDGSSLRSTDDASALDESSRRTASANLVAVLASIHAVDLDAAGLRDLARNSGYLSRQLGVWSRQWGLSTDRDVPAITKAEEQLHATAPADDGCVLVHGDYRFDNVLLTADHAVGAVLDWELSTLGDPLADLGLLVAYWTESQEVIGPLDAPPTTLPGFLTRAEVVEAYGAARGCDLPDIAWYVAFACWKLAIIMEGVRQRNAGGSTTGSDAVDVDDIERRVDALAEQALEELARGTT